MKDLNWNLYFNDRYSQFQERLMALDLMPASEERTELLRNYVRELEADILTITRNKNEVSDLVKRTTPSNAMLHMISVTIRAIQYQIC
jgi:hypothetical protein